MIPRIAVRVAGAVLVVVVAAWLALVEVFWLPLRVGGVPVPLSVPAAVAGNLLLVAVAHRLTGSRAVAVLPALVWLVVALAAMIRRPEGDLVLIGTGATGAVGTAFLLGGVVAGAFACGRVLGARPDTGARGSPVAPTGDPALPRGGDGAGKGTLRGHPSARG